MRVDYDCTEHQMPDDEIAPLVARMLKERGRFLYRVWLKDDLGKERCFMHGIMVCPHCGNLMLLSRGGEADFSCGSCGRDYFASGSEMAPRHCWGEETGESFGCACPSCRRGRMAED